MAPERREDDHRIAVLEERVKNWMDTTVDYRHTLCSKIDLIQSLFDTVNKKLDNLISELPCKERKAWYTSMEAQVRALWVLMVTVIIGLLIKIFL